MTYSVFGGTLNLTQQLQSWDLMHGITGVLMLDRCKIQCSRLGLLINCCMCELDMMSCLLLTILVTSWRSWWSIGHVIKRARV